jgi:hypothetical protein
MPSFNTSPKRYDIYKKEQILKHSQIIPHTCEYWFTVCKSLLNNINVIKLTIRAWGTIEENASSFPMRSPTW